MRKTLDIIISELNTLPQTSDCIAIGGYVILYDRHTYTIGKLLRVLYTMPIGCIMTFLINRGLFDERSICLWSIQSMDIRVCGRTETAEKALMDVLVRTLRKYRAIKRHLGFLTYLIIGFDDKLERYEEYYKELSKKERE